MNVKRPQDKFSGPARVFHWAVAAALPFQIYLGWAAEWEDNREESFRLIRTHFQLGVILFAVMLLRISWRIGHGAPLAVSESRWKNFLAATVHWLLYALLLTMPVSGYVIWMWMDAPMTVLNLVDIPRLFTPPLNDETGRALAWYIHVYSSWAVIALIALHLAAAAWHQFIRRDNLIVARML